MLSQDHTGRDLPYVDESSRLFYKLVWTILASSLVRWWSNIFVHLLMKWVKVLVGLSLINLGRRIHICFLLSGTKSNFLSRRSFDIPELLRDQTIHAVFVQVTGCFCFLVPSKRKPSGLAAFKFNLIPKSIPVVNGDVEDNNFPVRIDDSIKNFCP